MERQLSSGSQSIQAGNVNLGGSQVFYGPVSISMADLAQTLESVDRTSAAREGELRSLYADLERELRSIPPAHESDARTLARRAEDVAIEAAQAEPDADSVQFKAGKLASAAEKVVDALPAAARIASKIAALFGSDPSG